jgi:hypothetical protein
VLHLKLVAVSLGVDPEVSVAHPSEMHDGRAYGKGFGEVQESFTEVPKIPPSTAADACELALGQDADRFETKESGTKRGLFIGQTPILRLGPDQPIFLNRGRDSQVRRYAGRNQLVN